MGEVAYVRPTKPADSIACLAHQGDEQLPSGHLAVYCGFDQWSSSAPLRDTRAEHSDCTCCPGQTAKDQRRTRPGERHHARPEIPRRPNWSVQLDVEGSGPGPRWPRTRLRQARDSPAGPRGCAPPATRGQTAAPTPATGTRPAPPRAAHQAYSTSIGWARTASQAPARTTAHPPGAAFASGTTATAVGRSGSPRDHKAGRHAPRQIRRLGCRCRVNWTTGAREPDDRRVPRLVVPLPACAPDAATTTRQGDDVAGRGPPPRAPPSRQPGRRRSSATPEGPGRDQARDLALLIISGGAQVRALPLLEWTGSPVHADTSWQ
jgi:hypothetical protein